MSDETPKMDHHSISLAESTNDQLYDELCSRMSSFIFCGVERRERKDGDHDICTWTNGNTTEMQGCKNILNGRVERQLDIWLDGNVADE